MIATLAFKESDFFLMVGKLTYAGSTEDFSLPEANSTMDLSFLCTETYLIVEKTQGPWNRACL